MAKFDMKEAAQTMRGAKVATIQLGEREYVIQERRRSAQAEWRKRFEGAFESVSDMVVMMLRQIDRNIPGIKADADESTPAPETEQAHIAEAKGFLIQLLAQANSLVDGVLDQALDLVVSYSPQLEKDRDYISSDAYDSQIVDALSEVLQLAYPFGSLITQLGAMGKLPGTGSAKSKM